MKHLKESVQLLNKIVSKSFRRMLADLHADAEWVVDYLLRDYDIKPVIIGGLAVQRYGYRRFTEDIDILISRRDYDRLVEDGKIKFGQLKVKPGIQIDVLTEGKDDNPDPEFVRDGNSYWPTLEGLIYLKLLSGRKKDEADVVELIKVENASEDLLDRVLAFMPEGFYARVSMCFREAQTELELEKERKNDLS
jgi:hypothetical protein